VNREPGEDVLDEALRSRRATAPPSRFTAQVLAVVKSEPRLSLVEEFIAAYGIQAGVAAAAFGVWLAVDISPAAATLMATLQTPNAATVAGIVATCLVWVLMRQEPEGEAL
jgi:uncharacterized protein (DUF2342 family)